VPPIRFRPKLLAGCQGHDTREPVGEIRRAKRRAKCRSATLTAGGLFWNAS
jgi:hypothetical protein